MFVQNEFILLVNAYYQADAMSKNVTSSSVFGDLEIQPEISYFRDMIFRTSEIIEEAINNADANGPKGNLDKVLIGTKLKEVYGIDDNFIKEIEDSVSKFIIEENDMTSYRISFQMASDTLYKILHGVLKHIDTSVNQKNSIFSIVDDMLLKDYWEGEETKDQIEFIRTFKTVLFYSDNWVKEYAHRIFAQ